MGERQFLVHGTDIDNFSSTFLRLQMTDDLLGGKEDKIFLLPRDVLLVGAGLGKNADERRAVASRTATEPVILRSETGEPGEAANPAAYAHPQGESSFQTHGR